MQRSPVRNELPAPVVGITQLLREFVGKKIQHYYQSEARLK